MTRTNENKSNSNKILLAVTAVLLIVGVAVSGTIALLKAQTKKEVVNTFVVAGDIINVPPAPVPDDPVDPDIDPDELNEGFNITEHKVVVNSETGKYEKYVDDEGKGLLVLSNNYDGLVTGTEIYKDPKVYIDVADNVSAYVFVKVVDTTAGNIIWSASEDWTEITDELTGLNANEKVYVYKTPVVGIPNVEGEEPKGELYVSFLKNDKVETNSTFTDIDPKNEGMQIGALSFYGYACQSNGVADATAAFQKAFLTVAP